MATGLEKMLASMLGISPEQMQETIGEAINLLTTISENFERIESKLDRIIEHMEPADKSCDEIEQEKDAA